MSVLMVMSNHTHTLKGYQSNCIHTLSLSYGSLCFGELFSHSHHTDTLDSWHYKAAVSTSVCYRSCLQCICCNS